METNHSQTRRLPSGLVRLVIGLVAIVGIAELVLGIVSIVR